MKEDKEAISDLKQEHRMINEMLELAGAQREFEDVIDQQMGRLREIEKELQQLINKKPGITDHKGKPMTYWGGKK